MKKMLLLALLTSGAAQAGDWTGTFLYHLGGEYPNLKYVDYIDPSRWELAACEKLSAYIAGRIGLESPEDGRVATFVGQITPTSFWKTTNSLKGKSYPFPFGGKKATYIFKNNLKFAFPVQEITEPQNFKGTRFFVGLANPSYKPVLCVAAF